MYNIGEKIEFTIERRETNFDKACDSARISALSTFGVDEFGHINNVKDAHRSETYIEIIFKGYKQTCSMVGSDFIYTFEAVVLKCEEE